MNVLYFISSLSQGGAEILFLNFVKTSREDCTVAIMNDGVDEYLRQELLKTGRMAYFLNKNKKNKHPKYLFRLLKIIRENNIDIIHSHNQGSMMWSILCKIFKPKLKLVYTVHSSVFVKNWNNLTLFFNRTFIDMNIAISENILNDCLKNNLKAIKIYNGVDIKNLKLAQCDTKSFNIINVGRITYQVKGQDILLKALKECKDKGMIFTCNFVGGEYSGNKFSNIEYLKKLADELDLSEEISFLGEKEDISEFLAQSDLFVLPSRFEGLPLSLVEAMASKLPVIASNISGSADLIEHEKNGLLFESENHTDLAEKILFFYKNRETMKRLAQNGYEHAQGFDISVMCEKYWNLYKYLLSI